MFLKCPQCGSIRVNTQESLIGVGAAAEDNLPQLKKKPPMHYCLDCGHKWPKNNKNL